MGCYSSCSCWWRASIASCNSACIALSCSIYCCMTWDLFMTALCLAMCSCTSCRCSFSWSRCANSSSMMALISLESWCWSSWALTCQCRSWLWHCCCYNDKGGRSGAVVLVANNSTWVDGCPVGPSGLLASTATSWDSVVVCVWLVGGHVGS
jgi:hypothetical protein